MCYSSQEEYIFSQSSAEVKLQSIVDLTIKRLSIIQKKILNSITKGKGDVLKNITFIFKFGLDGSGVQSRYEQKSNENNFEDENILMVSMVPL